MKKQILMMVFLVFGVVSAVSVFGLVPTVVVSNHSISHDRFTVTLDYNESANSSIHFGAVSNLSQVSTVVNGSFTTNWSRVFSGLNQSTRYYYNVTFFDQGNAGNSTVTYNLTTPANNAPSVSLVSPDNGDVDSNTTLVVRFTYNDADGDSASWCKFFVNSTERSNMTGLSAPTTTNVQANLSGNATFEYYVQCNDGVASTSSAKRNYTLDTEAPDVDMVFPLLSNFSEDYNGIFTVNGSCTDNNRLFAYNFTVRNKTGSYVFRNDTYNITGTVVNFNYDLNFNAYPEQNFTFYVYCADAHTGKNISGKLDYLMRQNDVVEFQSLKSRPLQLKIGDFSGGTFVRKPEWNVELETMKDLDRYKTFVNFTVPSDGFSLPVVISSDEPVILINASLGHFVVGDMWIDFEEEVKNGLDLSIQSSGDDYIVFLRDVSWKKGQRVMVDPAVGVLHETKRYFRMRYYAQPAGNNATYKDYFNNRSFTTQWVNGGGIGPTTDNQTPRNDSFYMKVDTTDARHYSNTGLSLASYRIEFDYYDNLSGTEQLTFTDNIPDATFPQKYVWGMAARTDEGGRYKFTDGNTVYGFLDFSPVCTRVAGWHRIVYMSNSTHLNVTLLLANGSVCSKVYATNADLVYFVSYGNGGIGARFDNLLIYNGTEKGELGENSSSPGHSENDFMVAIEQAINATLSGHTINSKRYVYLRNSTNSQQLALFDKFIVLGSKRWAINFLNENETFTQMFNMTPVFYVFETADRTPAELRPEVEKFINATK